MKRSIFLYFLFLLGICNLSLASDPIDLGKTTPPPIPTSPTNLLPASATIDEYQLAVYFETSVGDATITVLDAANNVVYQETVDTDTTTSVFVASDNWIAGNYTLMINYGTTQLIGYFAMN